ncbi:hypothetical protein L1887_03469 [Cichorium endivia]|nr:hypothetical protein L1887_03469 [Cichorium endivia]
MYIFDSICKKIQFGFGSDPGPPTLFLILCLYGPHPIHICGRFGIPGLTWDRHRVWSATADDDAGPGCKNTLVRKTQTSVKPCKILTHP